MYRYYSKNLKMKVYLNTHEWKQHMTEQKKFKKGNKEPILDEAQQQRFKWWDD